MKHVVHPLFAAATALTLGILNEVVGLCAGLFAIAYTAWSWRRAAKQKPGKDNSAP